MKKLLVSLALSVVFAGVTTAEIVFGGPATTDLNNWTTSSVPFDDTVQSGFSMNWENVLVNDAVIDLVDNEFDLSWEAGTDYTIGHMFIYNPSVDLSTLTPGPGLSGLRMTANFEATAFANWTPVLEVTDGGMTTYYRWNHSGNSWNGNGPLDFSDPFPAGDPNEFDLSQNGNGTNSATGIWGELVDTAGTFAATRINANGPDLDSTTAVLRFGFIQWGASTGGNVAAQDFSTKVEFFEVVVDPDPVGDPTVLNIAATGVTAEEATIGSEVTATGNETPSGTLYWGTTDGTTNPLDWDFALPLGGQVGPVTAPLSGLQLDTTYFFRAFAENSGGSDWADATGSFTTLAALPPTVVVAPATVTSATTATVAGEVTDTGNETPFVTFYFGTTDGGTDPGAWDTTFDLGLQESTFSVDLEGLLATTTYFYRTFADNSAGTDWSDTAESFTTPAVVAPTVVAVGGTVNGPVSASLGGEVTDTGNEAPNVTIFYGTTDGGTDPGAWDTSTGVGIQGGAFSAGVSGLSPSTTYFYRPFADNSAGTDWADTAGMITTTAADGLDGALDSASFAYNYEMDVNPSTQDLDGAGSATDWFAGTAGGITIPQTYLGGVAFSNASPGDALGSIDTITKSGNEVTLGWTLSEPSAVEIYGNPDLDPGNWFIVGSAAATTTTFVDEFAFEDLFFYRLEFPSTGVPEVLFRTDIGGSIQRQSLGGDFTMELAVRIAGPKDDPGDVGIFGIAIDPGGPSSSLRLNIDASEVSLDSDGKSPV
ncbi:MAG: hypothetical protein HKO57_16280, partial [Akkermansiaceae bacterium]|nr:hypothetical protein [Akkermansiaceae bacterium]